MSKERPKLYLKESPIKKEPIKINAQKKESSEKKAEEPIKDKINKPNDLKNFDAATHFKQNIIRFDKNCSESIKDYSYYCFSCKHSVCNECGVYDHKEHLLIQRDNCLNYDSSFFNEISKVIEKGINIEERKTKIKEDISKSIKQIKEELDILEKQKMVEIDKLFNEIKDNYLLSGNKCIKCKTGIYDACKTCDSSNPNFCGSCNQGYYLPLNEQNKEKCKKCSDSISNCEECEYDDVNDKVVCTSCKLNYYVTSSKECDLACTIKSGKYCKTCNTPNLNQCKTCNYGYYLPSDDTEKSNCKKCTDLSNNCNECSGTLTSVVCKSCTNNYFLSSGICYKKCDIGENEYCQSCNSANQTQCETCNNGYFIPDDETIRIKCQKCSINNCKICSGNKLSDICTLCEDFTNPIYENGKIQNCCIIIFDFLHL